MYEQICTATNKLDQASGHSPIFAFWCDPKSRAEKRNPWPWFATLMYGAGWFDLSVGGLKKIINTFMTVPLFHHYRVHYFGSRSLSLSLSLPPSLSHTSTKHILENISMKNVHQNSQQLYFKYYVNIFINISNLFSTFSSNQKILSKENCRN